MKFKYEDLQYSILDGESDEELGLFIEEVEDWTQDGKYQSRCIIFKYKENYYRIEQTRSGSPFSEWHYEEHDIDKDGFIECEDVYKIPIIKMEWSGFPKKTEIDELKADLSEAWSLLSDARSLLNSIHGYDTDTYRNICKYLDGEDEE